MRDRLRELGYHPDSKLYRQAAAACDSVAGLKISFHLIANVGSMSHDVLAKAAASRD